MTWPLRIAVSALAAAALVATVLALAWRTPTPAPPPAPPALEDLALMPLPLAPASTRSAVLERSPFDPARGPFSRNAAPDPAASLSVRLIGVSTRGGRLRATIEIGGTTVQVHEGDDTPTGPVETIERNAVTLGGTAPRRVELFER